MSRTRLYVSTLVVLALAFLGEIAVAITVVWAGSRTPDDGGWAMFFVFVCLPLLCGTAVAITCTFKKLEKWL